MTVQKDLEKAIAYCEGLKGSYAIMADSTEDQQAKQMFKTMKSDMDKHLQFLGGRMEYLVSNNELYKSK